MSKENVVLVLFFMIALVYLLYVVYTTYFKKQEEHFTEDNNLTDYQARMTVMKVFDTVLHRKPQPDEIDKYAKITNEQDMLVAVLADYNVTAPTTPTTATTATETFDTVTPAPVPGTSTLPDIVPVGPITPAPTPATTSVVSKVKTIEDNLSNIMDSVNSIRALLHSQTMSEGS